MLGDYEISERSKLAETLDKLFNILENNFKYKFGKKIPNDEVFEMAKDISILIKNFEEYKKECATICIKRYIPLLNLLIVLHKEEEKRIFYAQELKYAYKIGARISLEHYFVYREWDEPEKEKFFEPRYNILNGYVHYLQEMVYNPDFTDLVANMPSGYGKLIANDIPVLTKNGWKKHGDLKVGDYVIGKNGEFVKVNIVHPKRLANVKVTFEDGEEILCHNQHEWNVYDREAKKEKERVETNYIIKHCHSKGGRNRFYLPLCEPIIGEKKNLPVDPYTYGVWLGDGSTKQPRITQNINDLIIFDYIPYKITNVFKGINDNVKSYYLEGLVNDLHKLDLCYQNKNREKYIHSMYLTSNIEQRLELLAGIIDTDGYLDKKKNRYIIVTCGEKLKEDIVSLISTFHWRTSITSVPAKKSTSGINGKKTTYYIGFNPTMYVPCKLKRKQLANFSKQRRIGISKTEFIQPIEGNCITVDGGLYLVGKTLILTHNTNPEKIAEAWSYGIDDRGAMLALCSNDDVVKSGSRTVIDEIKSEAFGEVFPHLKYNEDDKNFFLKETDEKWKLKNAKLQYSYYAKTTQANVVGSRASKWIHIDDLYPDYKEAMNQSLNKYYYNKSITVWEKRFIQNKKAKKVITGTLWASGDYIDLKIKQLEKEHKFTPHPKYKYTRISEDKSCVIIQVPALDYETNQSVCPEIKSTEELLKEKANMEEYLWETNFQQRPTNPEALIFSYDKIRTYENIPETDTKSSYAVIDATRKSGKDFFAMPIFKKVKNEYIYDYYLKDCLFTRTATKDMYDDIVDKIIEHHIIMLVIESNVTSELKQALEDRLKIKGITYCEIYEKYNTTPKSTRITNESGVIKKQIVFPRQNMFGISTPMGKFMDNLTRYNSTGSNENDDAPDSCALMSSEIIEENALPQKAVPLAGIREHF